MHKQVAISGTFQKFTTLLAQSKSIHGAINKLPVSNITDTLNSKHFKSTSHQQRLLHSQLTPLQPSLPPPSLLELLSLPSKRMHSRKMTSKMLSSLKFEITAF
jgi:hypothetical protein